MNRRNPWQPAQGGRTVGRENISGSGSRINGGWRSPAVCKHRGSGRARERDPPGSSGLCHLSLAHDVRQEGLATQRLGRWLSAAPRPRMQ